MRGFVSIHHRQSTLEGSVGPARPLVPTGKETSLPMAFAADTPHQPYDKLFKLAFGFPENAAGLLRAELPPALAAAIDWKSLHPQPGRSSSNPQLVLWMVSASAHGCVV